MDRGLVACTATDVYDATKPPQCFCVIRSTT